MFVIQLANGNLLVPEYAISEDGTLGEAYVEIGPEHSDYERLQNEAMSEQEDEERRRRWRAGDESLRREFLDYLARHGAGSSGDDLAD
jgi:hypothetical protein